MPNASFIHPGTPTPDLPCSACGQRRLMVLPYVLVDIYGVTPYQTKLICFACRKQSTHLAPAHQTNRG